jgi:hypothetical protein
MPKFSEHLAGPWIAALADHFQFVYPTVADAVDALGREALVEVAVVRGSAVPQQLPAGGKIERRPYSCDPADEAYVVHCLLVNPNYPGLGAEARLEQAKAMAAGLNHKGAQVETAQPVGSVL